MYKKTHDSHDFIRRVASHSTKGSRTGLVTILPPEAETEAVYGSLKEQLAALCEQRDALVAKRTKIADMLKVMQLPKYEYNRAMAERARLTEKAATLNAKISTLRDEIVRLGRETWESVFVRVAKEVMTHEQFIACVQQTSELLGRPATEIKRAAHHRTGNPDTRKARVRDHHRKARKADSAAWMDRHLHIDPSQGGSGK